MQTFLQSLAVMVGALEGATLTASQRTSADAIGTQVKNFLDAQEQGYEDFVDAAAGQFRMEVKPSTGVFTGHIDRFAQEFRGAIAFLLVRFPDISQNVWNNLSVVTKDYTDRDNKTIKNLAYFDGSAFQAFWPGLRNDERRYIETRNALHNALLTFTDFSSQNNIPGYVSASQRLDASNEGFYYPTIGIRSIAEGETTNKDKFIQNVGSTYALAAASGINSLHVLQWMDKINKGLPDLNGAQGFLDAAISASEIAKLYNGIDVGSMILGLANTGPEAFLTYLRNRTNYERNYNLLYEGKSLGIDKATDATLASVPEFADRSQEVFKIFPENPVALSGNEGTINNFTANPTSFTGVDFDNQTLTGGFGGQTWDFAE